MVIVMRKKLVIMPPSYKRKMSGGVLPAIEMYDGVLYRVLRANMPKEGVDVVILTEELQLISGDARVPYKPPAGKRGWSGYGPASIPEEVVKQNLEYLRTLLESRKYDEVFVALGERWRGAVRGIDKIAKEMNIKVSYIHGGGLGPYQASLKRWLESIGE